jgi:hypothetical protein
MRRSLYKDLSGLSIEAIVKCHNQSFRENILITHKGACGNNQRRRLKSALIGAQRIMLLIGYVLNLGI